MGIIRGTRVINNVGFLVTRRPVQSRREWPTGGDLTDLEHVEKLFQLRFGEHQALVGKMADIPERVFCTNLPTYATKHGLRNGRFYLRVRTTGCSPDAANLALLDGH